MASSPATALPSPSLLQPTTSTSSTQLPLLPIPARKLNYPGWQKDQEEAERIYIEHHHHHHHHHSNASCSSNSALHADVDSCPFSSSLLHKKLQAMQTKQRLHDGVPLSDAITLRDSVTKRKKFTYRGWQRDQKEAERRLIGDCSVLQLGTHSYVYEKMIKKQNLSLLLLNDGGENDKKDDDDDDESDEEGESEVGTFPKEENEEEDETKHSQNDMDAPTTATSKEEEECSTSAEEEEGQTPPSLLVVDPTTSTTTAAATTTTIPSCLQELHQVAKTLTYENFKEDVLIAQKLYIDYPTTTRFYDKLNCMKQKQQCIVHRDRSHPDIQLLQSTTFTYPDWQQDAQEYMNRHTGDCPIFQFGITTKFIYDKMMKKQQLYTHRQSIPEIQTLDSLCETSAFTYDNWRYDKQLAEQYYIDYSSCQQFYSKVNAMKQKQQLLVNRDRSHPEIVLLDTMKTKCYYPEFDKDYEQAIQRHIGDCTVLQLNTFSFIISKMKKQQLLYEQRLRFTEECLYNTVALEASTTSSSSSSSSSFPALLSNSSSSLGSGVDGLYNNNNNSLLSSTSLTTAATTGTDNKKCVVCMEQTPCFAFIPCGHLCLCAGCVTPFQNHAAPISLLDNNSSGTTSNYDDDNEQQGQHELKCPMCRKSSLTVTRIFT